MQALDAAAKQTEADSLFADALASWREDWEARAKKASRPNKKAALKDKALDPEDKTPLPVPPPLKPELSGLSATEHLLRCTNAVKSSEVMDVLLALPFDYAFRVS